MATGYKDGPFLLKEGSISIGTWTNPDTIGNGTVNDPSALFSGTILGYFRQGTTTLNITRSYAEARAFTPSIIVRKDLIQKDFMLNCELFQYDIDTLEIAKGLLVQSGYTGTGAIDHDYGWIGSDEPTQPYYGYYVDTELTDGTPFRIGMWYGKALSEDISDTLSGTDFSTIPFSVTAFPGPTFDKTGTEAQKHYGIYWIDNT